MQKQIVAIHPTHFYFLSYCFILKTILDNNEEEEVPSKQMFVNSQLQLLQCPRKYLVHNVCANWWTLFLLPLLHFQNYLATSRSTFFLYYNAHNVFYAQTYGLPTIAPFIFSIELFIQ